MKIKNYLKLDTRLAFYPFNSVHGFFNNGEAGCRAPVERGGTPTFSTLATSIKSQVPNNIISSDSEKTISKELNPWFITGFADAEASFRLNIHKSKNVKIGWGVIPTFSIELHGKDKLLLGRSTY